MNVNNYFKAAAGSLMIAVTAYLVFMMVVPFFAFHKAEKRASEIEKAHMIDDSVPALAQQEVPDVVYIDIHTSKGTVTVHTGMPKDSVLILMGEPTSFSFGDFSFERCEYALGDYKYVNMFFQNGKLTEVKKH